METGKKVGVAALQATLCYHGSLNCYWRSTAPSVYVFTLKVSWCVPDVP